MLLLVQSCRNAVPAIIYIIQMSDIILMLCIYWVFCHFVSQFMTPHFSGIILFLFVALGDLYLSDIGKKPCWNTAVWRFIKLV